MLENLSVRVHPSGSLDTYVADTPSNCALFTRSRGLVRLTLDAFDDVSGAPFAKA